MSPLLNYDSPLSIRAFLESRSLGASKRFGQNFLIDPHARRVLVDALCAEAGSLVWEIGPGLGAMTRELLDRDLRVKAFEVDRGFVQALGGLFAGEKNLELIQGDAAETWRGAEPAPYLLGNLPYSAGAAILGSMIEGACLFHRMVVTVQKEMAQRMVSHPGAKSYSSFTVLCASAYTVKPLISLRPNSFYPAPHVDSCGLVLERRHDAPRYPAFFTTLVRGLFSSRRKVLGNSLFAFLSARGFGGITRAGVDALLESVNLDPRSRAENLSVEEFSALSNAVMGQSTAEIV